MILTSSSCPVKQISEYNVTKRGHAHPDEAEVSR